MTSTSMKKPNRTDNTAPAFMSQYRNLWIGGMLLMIAFSCTFVYLLPFGNMALLSVKDSDQPILGGNTPILPLELALFEYDGDEYPVYEVPLGDDPSVVTELALVQGRRTQVNDFIDPTNTEAGIIVWEGNWRELTPVQTVNPRWENYSEAWNGINFPKVFANTLYIALVGMVGTIISSLCVGYAFARFPIPGKNILFIILIGTIILPGQVTLIPTFALFNWLTTTLQEGLRSLGLPSVWASPIRAVIAWLPLTLPHFFANAYNVFLFRQYFMTLPKELDEAAMIDGAGPLRILIQIIIPLSWPVIIAVGLFHFIFSWNDYFGPLIYLLNYPDLNPISVAVQIFNYQYGARPELVQATSLMAMLLPVLIFFFTQRIFMRGVVLTGVDK
ncbi:MAG: carbohydrate ABC transporter permease [Phototrophicaceae bacterium]